MTPLAKVEQQRRSFLKSGWRHFLEIERKKGGSFDAHLRAVVCVSRGRGDPDGSEGLLVRFA
jgi:hypothetical protein